MNEKKIYSSRFLFFGLLLYTIVFYSQIAGRYPVLAPFRVEFVIGAILLFIIVFKIINNEIDLKENNLSYAALVFLLACGITIPFAFVKTRALETYIQLLKFFSIYFMIISCINTEEKQKTFFYLYLSMISLLFIEPFILSLKGEGFRYNNHMMRLYGVTGFFEHPNQLGGIVSANLPFFYYMFLYHKSLYSKITFLILICIAVWVVMLTQSRTAFIGVIAFALFVWLLNKKKIFYLIIFIVSATIAWQFAPEQTKSRFSTLGKSVEVITAKEDTFKGDLELGSVNSRFMLLKRSFMIFLKNPLLGVGIGCYPSVSGRRWNSWFPTHCLYTQALSEIGLIGTFAFSFVLFKMFKNIKLSKDLLFANNDKTFHYHLNSALFMFLAIRLVIGLFGHDLYRNWWWLAAGLSVTNLRILKSRYQDVEN